MVVWTCFKPLAFLYLQLSCFCVLFGFSRINQQKRSVCDLAIKRKIKIIHLIFFQEEKPQEVSILPVLLQQNLRFSSGFLKMAFTFLDFRDVTDMPLQGSACPLQIPTGLFPSSNAETSPSSPASREEDWNEYKTEIKKIWRQREQKGQDEK